MTFINSILAWARHALGTAAMAIGIVLSLIESIAYYVLFAGWLDLIGLFIVPLAIAYREERVSPLPLFDADGKPAGPRTVVNAPRWLYPWGNDEDGYLPEWYRLANPTWSEWQRMYMWAAIRNSTGNVRFIKWINPPQRADKVHWITRGRFTLVWQGIFTRLIYKSPTRWVGIGWKYEPAKEDSTGWQTYGIGFGIRIVRA